MSSPRSTTLGSKTWKKCPSFSSKHSVSPEGQVTERFTPCPINTWPSGRSTTLVVASGCRIEPTFRHFGLGSVNSITSTVPVGSPPASCPEIMNHLCEVVCPSSLISTKLAVEQQYGLTSEPLSRNVQWFFAGVLRFGSFIAPTTSRHHVLPSVKRGVPPPTPNLAPPRVRCPWAFR